MENLQSVNVITAEKSLKDVLVMWVSPKIQIFSKGHPYKNKSNYVMEHRLVMEKSLGRHLLPSEAVHHIDGDHQNNHPDNLLVFDSNGEHLRHELMGKTPNYSPEGLQRMRENAQRVNRLRGSANRKESKTDVAE